MCLEKIWLTLSSGHRSVGPDVEDSSNYAVAAASGILNDVLLLDPGKRAANLFVLCGHLDARDRKGVHSGVTTEARRQVTRGNVRDTVSSGEDGTMLNQTTRKARQNWADVPLAL
ncbi:hypothetical protein OKW45_002630 [Paraburkholderia sp. WSM4175]|uniref:hypothetical protein n=1 Tax=Paraburkholderia sp. WSM4175 TaxID=2991072 RepID=UPI003D22CF35